MTSNDRMYIAMSGGVPDRVPCMPKIWVDLACDITNTSLLSIISDPAALLDVMARAAVMVGSDGFRQFHFPERNIALKGNKVYEIDTHGAAIGQVDVNGGLITHLYNADDFHYQDPWFMAHNHYWTSNSPLIPDLDAVAKMCVPEKAYYHEMGCADRQLSVINEYGDQYAIIGDCDTATMAFLVTMRGMEQALTDLLLNPRLVHRIMDKGTAYCIEKGKFNIDLGIRMLRLNDSVGNMNVISPEQWEEFVYPHLRSICSALHSYCPDVRIYSHICGNVMPILDKLVGSGLDCIGPLDPLGGVSVEEVRNLVGNDIALLGGVNTISFVDEQPDAIIQEARHCITCCGMHGGYILSSGCVLPRDSKKNNLHALVDAARHHGRYTKGHLASTL